MHCTKAGKGQAQAVPNSHYLMMFFIYIQYLIRACLKDGRFLPRCKPKPNLSTNCGSCFSSLNSNALFYVFCLAMSMPGSGGPMTI